MSNWTNSCTRKVCHSDKYHNLEELVDNFQGVYMRSLLNTKKNSHEWCKLVPNLINGCTSRSRHSDKDQNLEGIIFNYQGYHSLEGR